LKDFDQKSGSLFMTDDKFPGRTFPFEA